ncbi:MAG: MFS transporter [Pseudomonadota bacterium]
MAARFFLDNARWLGAGVALTLASSFGQTFFISLFAGHLMAAYALSHGEWSTIYLAGTLASAAVLIQAGRLADRMALGRLALMVLALYTAVAVAMWVNPSAWMLAVLIFGLRFCGQGMMGHIAITAMGRWFAAHRGRAVAVAGLGYALGEALLPPIAILAIAGLGWREAWLAVAALLALAFAPLIGHLLRSERIPRGSVEDMAQTGLAGRNWTRGEATRHWLFWAVLPGVITPSFVGTVIFFHQVHTAEVKGWDLATMALAYSVYAALTVVASLAAGWAVDRFGSARLLPVYLIAMGLGTWLIGPASHVSAWFLALALVGLSTGMANAMWGAFWPEHYGTRNLGGIKALATAAMVFGSALGPFVTGWAIDFGWSFPEQCAAMAAWCLVLSGSYILAARRARAELLDNASPLHPHGAP